MNCGLDRYELNMWLLHLQLRAADVVVINKCDLASLASLSGVEDLVQEMAPGVRTLRARFGQVGDHQRCRWCGAGEAVHSWKRVRSENGQVKVHQDQGCSDLCGNNCPPHHSYRHCCIDSIATATAAATAAAATCCCGWCCCCRWLQKPYWT